MIFVGSGVFVYQQLYCFIPGQGQHGHPEREPPDSPAPGRRATTHTDCQGKWVRHPFFTFIINFKPANVDILEVHNPDKLTNEPLFILLWD